MLIERRTRKRRPAATPLVALWAAICVVLAIVAPALAVEGPTQLVDAERLAATGTPTTKIIFEVDVPQPRWRPRPTMSTS